MVGLSATTSNSIKKRRILFLIDEEYPRKRMKEKYDVRGGD